MLNFSHHCRCNNFYNWSNAIIDTTTVHSKRGPFESPPCGAGYKAHCKPLLHQYICVLPSIYEKNYQKCFEIYQNAHKATQNKGGMVYPIHRVTLRERASTTPLCSSMMHYLSAWNTSTKPVRSKMNWNIFRLKIRPPHATNEFLAEFSR